MRETKTNCISLIFGHTELAHCHPLEGREQRCLLHLGNAHALGHLAELLDQCLINDTLYCGLDFDIFAYALRRRAAPDVVVKRQLGQNGFLCTRVTSNTPLLALTLAGWRDW